MSRNERGNKLEGGNGFETIHKGFRAKNEEDESGYGMPLIIIVKKHETHADNLPQVCGDHEFSFVKMVDDVTR